MLSKRWSLVAEVGVGLYFIRDDEKDCNTAWSDDELVRHSRRFAVGPSKAEVSFTYLF